MKYLEPNKKYHEIAAGDLFIGTIDSVESLILYYDEYGEKQLLTCLESFGIIDDHWIINTLEHGTMCVNIDYYNDFYVLHKRDLNQLDLFES